MSLPDNKVAADNQRRRMTPLYLGTAKLDALPILPASIAYLCFGKGQLARTAFAVSIRPGVNLLLLDRSNYHFIFS